MAKNALGGVFAAARVIIHFHVHGTSLDAFAAIDALVFVAPDANVGVIAHGLEKHRDGADVLTEGPVVLERDGKQDSHKVI